MKKNKMSLILFIIFLFSAMLVSSCGKKQEKPTPKSEDEPKPMPPVVEEIESEIINIMSEVDMIPYYKKQIDAKKEKEKEKKELAIKLGMESQNSSDQSKSSGGQQGGQQKDMSGLDSLVKFEPSPITINDILLSDILKAEATGKKQDNANTIPNDIVFIWSGINTKIMDLHKKWNALESEVTKSGASPEAIKGFENDLNNLTISASQYNFLDTLFYSNKLTSYIPDLINNYKKKVPSQIYFMKYHLRQLILDYRINNSDKASNDYNKLIVYKDALVSQLIDKKLAEQANKLNTSVKSLENALRIKDLNIIKIKASVLMSNIQSIVEEVAK